MAALAPLAAGCHGHAAVTTSPDAAVGSDTGVDTSGTGADTAVATASQPIGPAGGQVTAPGGASVTVPAGALAATTTIGVTIAAAATAAGGAATMPALPSAVAPAGDVVALTPHGASFAAPVTIHVPFDPTLAAQAAGRPLRLFTAAPSGSWTEITGARAAAAAGALDADVTHFSFFVVGYEVPGQTLPESQTRKVDMLFMVDDSQSMQPLQQKLLAGFPTLMQTLKNLPGGLPDVHIGVVSSDLGAGRFADNDVPGCRHGGDTGTLQATPRTAGCLGPHDNFIAATPNEQTKNYDGTIEEAFSCIAALGDQGCGFEHQLESVAVALGARGAPPAENAGFLRPDALLAIVLITNEDDCSGPPDSDLYDPTSRLVSDALGPLASWRCNEYGHVCGGAPPPRRGTLGATVALDDCHSAEDGRLVRVADYLAIFKSLKADPRQIFLSAITGPVTPYAVTWTTSAVPDPDAWPQVAHSCTLPSGEFADPSVRIGELVAGFGANGSISSICGDFAPALTGIGAALSQALGPRCLQAALVDAGGLRAGCRVYESVPAPGGQRSEQALAACAAGAPAGAACWAVQAQSACLEAGAELTVTRSDSAPAGAALVVRCAP